MSYFLRKDNEYVREINVVEGYMEQLLTYLMIATGKSKEICGEWIRTEFSKGGRFEMNAPVANINIRDKDTGDRTGIQVKTDKLLKLIEKNDIISSPSLTFYTPAKTKRSLLSIFIDVNIKTRGVIKKQMMTAMSNGDKQTASNKKNEQNSFKTRNNALSGAHSSQYTILYNKSTHSTLTSTCRTATSYGNANNEKLLAGSRHYWMAGIVINNILSICTLTEFETFQNCMDYYDMHYPTVAETMECITYSTEPFWGNASAMDHIEHIVENLTPIQRAAFVYIGDLYHVRKYNPEVIRGWLGKMIERVTVPATDDEVKGIEDNTTADLRALVALLRSDIVGPRNIFKVKEANYDDYKLLMATSRSVNNACGEYSLFIREIMNTRNVPISVAKIPDTIRRVSLVSDTDSTMATVQDWSQWYCGTMTGVEADNIADSIIYIATQNIGHMMASMSIQMGVEDTYLHRYTMKNEFKFSSFALTNKAKHYFSHITSQEGTLYKDPELEVKGVALRTSNIPATIMTKFRKVIKELSTTVMLGNDIEIVPLLEHVAEIEHSIVASVQSGDFIYLKTGQIKDKSAYSIPESSSYAYWDWWETTFGPKYGTAGAPSYAVVKIAVNLNNKTQIKDWIASMADRELAGRIEEWHKRFPKRKFTQLLLPESVVANNGIPKEILDIAAYRRIIFSSVEPYYHILECFKVMMIDKNRTKLVSDYYGDPIDIEPSELVGED